MTTKAKNPGKLSPFLFHGAFKDKRDAERKERSLEGAFIREVKYPGGPRYQVVTRRRNGLVSGVKAVAAKVRENLPGARWDRMKPAQRRILALKARMEPAIARIYATKSWAKLPPGLRSAFRQWLLINPGAVNPRKRKVQTSVKKAVSRKRTVVRKRNHIGGVLVKAANLLPLVPVAKRSATKKKRNASPARRSAVSTKQTARNVKRVRRNPDAQAQAAKLYQRFHGKAVDKFDEIVQAHGLPAAVIEQLKSLVPPTDYTKLGDLVSLRTKEGRFSFQDDPGGQPILASNPEGTQLYVIGGNQNLEALLGKLDVSRGKLLLDLGECVEVEYLARKRFDQFKPYIYFHALGEESGKRPRMMYDRKARQIYLIGGNYKVKPEGIVD